MRQINKIIIHCSDTYPDMDIGIEEIRRWHTEDFGWRDVGYHYVITRDGKAEAGRKEDVIGAHAAGHNVDSIGICMVGGKARTGQQACNFTKAQWDMLDYIVFTLMANRYPDAAIIGHNDVSDKACPTFDVKEWAKKRDCV